MSEPDWEKMARALWGLLDDISTLGDQHKPERTAFVRAVDRVCERRGDYLHSTDGHTLVVTNPGGNQSKTANIDRQPSSPGE